MNKKIGFIVQKNDSPLFIRSHVHVIKENGFNYVDFRFSDEDFKALYLSLKYGIEIDKADRVYFLLDLFQSIYSRL